MAKLRVEVDYTARYELYYDLPDSVIEEIEKYNPGCTSGSVAQVTLTKEGNIRFNVDVEDENDDEGLREIVKEKLETLLLNKPDRPSGELWDVDIDDMRIVRRYD